MVYGRMMPNESITSKFPVAILGKMIFGPALAMLTNTFLWAVNNKIA